MLSADQGPRGQGVNGGAAPPITVIGPTTIAKGTANVFRTVDEQGNPPTDQVVWEVVDGSVGGADVKPETTTGPFTVITVQKPGIFILKVTVAGRTPATIPITVLDSVAEPKRSGLKAFFLGDGYGTINLALFLMGRLQRWARSRVRDGTVSTIFGAMAGYIFGIAVVSTNKSGGSDRFSGVVNPARIGPSRSGMSVGADQFAACASRPRRPRRRRPVLPVRRHWWTGFRRHPPGNLGRSDSGAAPAPRRHPPASAAR